MTERKTDVLVIGGGPGGYVAAIRAAQLGKKVILAEKENLGGECLNHGCIPSKALIGAGHIYEKAKNASAMGIVVKDAEVHFEKVIAWKNGVVSKLRNGVSQLLKGNGVEVIQGEASFIGQNAAQIKTAVGTEKIGFHNAIIATGSESAELKNFSVDGERILSSRSALSLKKIPEHLIVIGGGFIGLELGMAYMAFGSKLTVVEIMDSLLPGTDADLVRVVERALRRKGVNTYLNARAETPTLAPNGVKSEVSSEGKTTTVEGSCVLVTVGRRPYTKELRLENANLSVNEKGFVSVNEKCQTKVPNIYAIGDVVGGPLLAHKASYEGEIAAEAIAGRAGERLEYSNVPWAIFTSPEIAGVGLTEAQARERGAEILVGKFPFLALGRAHTLGETDGFVKIVADKATHRVLGISMVGPNVSDLMGEGALSVKIGATLEDISRTCHVHPTLSEGLMEAAKDALGEAIHILKK